jgi:hypothetical protein
MGQLTRPKSSAEKDRDVLQWTLDNVYTIARRELHRATRQDHEASARTVEMWGHVVRLCEKAGCQGRTVGVLRDVEAIDKPVAK